MFTMFPAFICYNANTKGLRRSMLLRIMGQHGGSGNSFEVRLTSSGLDSGIDNPGQHGVYTRLILWTPWRATVRIVHVSTSGGTRGMAFPCQCVSRALVSYLWFPVIVLSVPNVLRLPNDEWQSGAILHDPQNEAKVSGRHRLRLATVGGTVLELMWVGCTVPFSHPNSVPERTLLGRSKLGRNSDG